MRKKNETERWKKNEKNREEEEEVEAEWKTNEE